MFRNFLKVTLRNAINNKAYTLINILGLGVGLAASIMMAVYVYFELSFDQFHTSKDQTYRLVLISEGYAEGGIAKIKTPAGPVLQESIPGIEEMTRLVYFAGATFELGDNLLAENNGLCVDRDFFSVFDFVSISGNLESAFDEPNSLVLTKSMAEKYFGEDDPMGQTILVSNRVYQRQPFKVTGVVEDVPQNSHFDFDFLTPIENVTIVDPDDWDRNQAYTYLKLKSDTELSDVERRAFEIVLANSASFAENFSNSSSEVDEGFSPFKLQPLTDIYLHSKLFREIGPTGDVLYVYIISSLALFVILIASVNFINLATARAITRAKEVGVRKANGARRSQLVTQFIFESVSISLVSLLVAVGLVELFLPSFNAEIDRSLTLNYSLFLPYLLLGTVMVGVLAGIYPAFYLSSFQASKVLKDNIRFSSKSRLRQALVIFQFTLSIGLVLASSIIYIQVDYMKGKDLGFKKDQIINISTNSTAINSNYTNLINELKQHPNIMEVSFSGNLPGGGDWGIPFSFEGVDDDSAPSFRVLEVDENFLGTYGMELTSGRNFSADIGSDVTGGYLLNEEGARQLGWAEPLGKKIFSKPLNWEGEVIGVVKDFHFRSLHEKISPIILFMNPDWSGTYSIKLGEGDFNETVDFVDQRFADFDPSFPFSFKFFDQSIDKLYQAEERLQYVVRGFTILTILIAGIGLFGLASYSVVSRTKEFGVRKVLGATVGSLIGLLSSDFIRLILISFVIAAPLAFLGMNRWLENFAYKTTISPLIYLIILLGMLAFALLTILYQAIRASRQNPVDSLRWE